MTPGPTLKVVGRYEVSGGVELEGTLDEVSRLAVAIRGDRHGNYTLEHAAVSAAPYDGLLRELVVEPADGQIMVTRIGDSLRIEGSREKLHVLAENVEALVNSCRGDAETETSASSRHMHFEYYPDHVYLRQGSQPLVVSVKLEEE